MLAGRPLLSSGELFVSLFADARRRRSLLSSSSEPLLRPLFRKVVQQGTGRWTSLKTTTPKNTEHRNNAALENP